MKGIYYNRHCGYDNRDQNKDDWYQPTEGEAIVLNRQAFTRFFPELQVQGDVQQPSGDDDSDECDRNGQSVKITFGRDGAFTATACNEYQTHNVDEFQWGWSGSGANEHWFDDEAICLKSNQEYRSGTGLTADSSRVVAYKRHVEVDSFRGDCKDEKKLTRRSGKIWAEFVNRPAQYRANWTGFGIGTLSNGGRHTASGEWVSDATPIIGGDALDNLIETMLSGNIGKETVCRHNSNVRAHIVTTDPNKISLYLCKSCRMRGVRWEEFMTRNRADTCPYFRRACKSVVEKSDSFPEWFSWNGDNLLSSTLRLKDGEYNAYEVVYVRRKEGFIRRSVLLLNDRTREVWMFRYNGFIPRTMQEFKTKYAEGRQINGYMGTGPTEGYQENPNDRFLSEAKIAAAVTQGLEQPVWKNGSSALISIDLGRDDLHDFAIQKGEINGYQIAQLDHEGKECELEAKPNPAPFYTDAGASYHLIYGDWSQHTVLRHHGEELYRSDRSNYKWFMLRTAKQ